MWFSRNVNILLHVHVKSLMQITDGHIAISVNSAFCSLKTFVLSTFWCAVLTTFQKILIEMGTFREFYGWINKDKKSQGANVKWLKYAATLWVRSTIQIVCACFTSSRLSVVVLGISCHLKCGYGLPKRVGGWSHKRENPLQTPYLHVMEHICRAETAHQKGVQQRTDTTVKSALQRTISSVRRTHFYFESADMKNDTTINNLTTP